MSRVAGIVEAYRPYEMAVADGRVHRIRIGQSLRLSSAALPDTIQIAAMETVRDDGEAPDGSGASVPTAR